MVRDRLNQLDPLAVVKSIHTQPVLFITRTGENYSPVQDVMSLANSVGARHEVLIADDANSNPGGAIEKELCEFLMKATQWRRTQ